MYLEKKLGDGDKFRSLHSPMFKANYAHSRTRTFQRFLVLPIRSMTDMRSLRLPENTKISQPVRNLSSLSPKWRLRGFPSIFFFSERILRVVAILAIPQSSSLITLVIFSIHIICQINSINKYIYISSYILCNI